MKTLRYGDSNNAQWAGDQRRGRYCLYSTYCRASPAVVAWVEEVRIVMLDCAADDAALRAQILYSTTVPPVPVLNI